MRGVVLTGQVILEKNMLEDPLVRAAAARAGLALVLDMKSTIGSFAEGGSGRADVLKILADLAAVSGYSEIAQAPILSAGHSGGAIFAWNLAYALPERCFGVIGLKAAPIGPLPGLKPQNGDGGGFVLNNIPVLCITGQYEAWNQPVRTPEYHWRWVRGTLLDFRARGHNALMSMLVEPGMGHFSWHDDLARYVGLFIEKAARARIPVARPLAGQLPVLRDVPQQEGWLSDHTFFSAPVHATAAFSEYTGDPSLAFWHLDEELARANDAFVARHRGQQLQQITFLDAQGAVLPPKWMPEIPLPPLDPDGSFRVAATFLSETSPDFARPATRPLGHAPGPITFRLIGGWSGGGRQTGPASFRIALDRFSFLKRPDSLMFIASHPGDATYAPYEQPLAVRFPARLKEGTSQKITFAPIPDQAAASPGVTLSALSSADLPVEFFVIDGPAEITGDRLTLTAIPPRSQRPLKVTVGAWNWGRPSSTPSAPGAPAVQTAEPVLRSFLVN